MVCKKCGAEISESVSFCSMCGTNVAETTQEDSAANPTPLSQTSPNAPTRKKPIIIGAIALLLVAVLIICLLVNSANGRKYADAERELRQENYETAATLFRSLGGYKEAKENAAYCTALNYCSVGDYESAYIEIKDFTEFPNAQKLLVEIYYETRLFEGINNYKSKLKNPDSLSINDVSVCYKDKWDKAEPMYVFTASGQNGFGGYATNYVLITYSDSKKAHSYLASCSSLSVSDIDKDDMSEALNLAMVSVALEDPKIENVVNLDRVNKIISEKNSGKVKRVNALTYALISKSVSEQ